MDWPGNVLFETPHRALLYEGGEVRLLEPNKLAASQHSCPPPAPGLGYLLKASRPYRTAARNVRVTWPWKLYRAADASPATANDFNAVEFCQSAQSAFHDFAEFFKLLRL